MLSCQFAVDRCLYHCNVDQELNVLQMKFNNEFFFIVELRTLLLIILDAFSPFYGFTFK